MRVKTETKSCTTYGYMPLQQPYVMRVYPVTVTACTMADGSRALRILTPDGTKQGQRAMDDCVRLGGVMITEAHAASTPVRTATLPGEQSHELNTKYFDRVFSLLQNAG